MQPRRKCYSARDAGGNAVIENRSVPPDAVLPHVVYQDVDQAMAWLNKTFGFVEHYRYGDPTSGVRVHLANAWVMLKQAREGAPRPAKHGSGTPSLRESVYD